MTFPDPRVTDSGAPEFPQDFEQEVARRQARLEAERIANLPVTPAEERTGVSDRAAAALADVAELRRETFRLWSAGTVGRHDGLARLDRIEAALRGEQR